MKPSDFVDETEIIEKQTFTAAELYDLDADRIPCLIEPIIPSVGIFSIVGSSDTGKSMILRQMALNVVSNDMFLNFKINAVHKKVIFIATEDDNVSTSFLLKKQTLNRNNLENLRFYFETDAIPEYLEEQLDLDPVDLIIIDAWSDVFGQNLNDSALIRSTLNIYRSIAFKYQCSIGFLHHTGKRTQKLVPSKDNILSGQGFEAKMRLVIELRNDIEDDAYKHFCIVKGNYLGKEFKSSSYKLEFSSDNFTFLDTGVRVPFDELAELSEIELKKQPLTKAHEIEDGIHYELLTEVFRPLNKPKLSEIKTRLSSIYSKKFDTVFGGKRSDAFFDYCMNDLEFIKKEGKDRSPNAFYYLATDHLENKVMSKVVSSTLFTTNNP